MKIGLVGFAGSGKTTVFNTMTGLSVPVGFGGELRIGTVRVPDLRIDALAKIFTPKKTTYAEMSFSDIPGEHGADQKGLSSKGIEQIRVQEALCLVLRDFDNPALTTGPDPLRDLEAFHLECIFADLGVIERRLERMKKERAAQHEQDAFALMQRTLESARPLRSLAPEELDRNALKGYQFLTDRALLVAVNRDESRATEPMPSELTQRVEELDAAGLVLSASAEADIAALEPAEQAAFLEDLGLHESALARFIRTAYGLLDLISFFTVGPDEVRAWPIRRGMNAKQAAGRIHSDLERGFIRAEVIPYDVFTAHGSEAAVKTAGLLQIEGKDYIMGDGDIVQVRFNV
ncbi:MAG: redox-regulated ATPase YchF [Gemmatimonadetes bacterium]|nr:redox-regulated ATPase YchF [Gemmatimonadota bacterium]